MDNEVVDPVKDLLQIRCVEDPFWAADRIIELEQRLTIDTLNPNRRSHIVDLVSRIDELEKSVAHQLRQHYETCESEGLTWDGDIPPEVED